MSQSSPEPPPKPKENEKPSNSANFTRLGKGYSCLFAALLTVLIGIQCLDISFKTNETKKFQISVSTRESSPYIFYTYTALIASILGLPTDAIALFVGQLLDKNK